jgi:hypothetical protein
VLDVTARTGYFKRESKRGRKVLISLILPIYEDTKLRKEEKRVREEWSGIYTGSWTRATLAGLYSTARSAERLCERHVTVRTVKNTNYLLYHGRVA